MFTLVDLAQVGCSSLVGFLETSRRDVDGVSAGTKQRKTEFAGRAGGRRLGFAGGVALECDLGSRDASASGIGYGSGQFAGGDRLGTCAVEIANKRSAIATKNNIFFIFSPVLRGTTHASAVFVAPGSEP